MVATQRGRVRAQAPDDARGLRRGDRRRDDRPRRLRTAATRSRSSATALLRYATPLLHLVALGREPGASRRGLGLHRHARRSARDCSPQRPSPPLVPLRPLRLAQYYVLTTASIAAWALATGFASARPVLGSRRRARDEAGARPRDRGDCSGDHVARARRRGDRDQARLPRASPLPRAPRRSRRCRVRALQAANDAHRQRPGWASGRPCSPTIRA